MGASAIVFDPTSREYQADPYPILGLIPEAEPLHRSNMGWLVTRYEHAAAILRDWRHGELPSHAKHRSRDTVPAPCWSTQIGE